MGQKLREWVASLERSDAPDEEEQTRWIEQLLGCKISITDVPQDQRKPVVWNAAARANGEAAMRELGHHPEQRPLEVLKAIVTGYPKAIEHLTPEERTQELCLLAVRGHGHVVHLLTEEQRTPQVCLEAVTNWGHAIQHLTSAQRTLPVCVAAVRNCANAIRHLNDQERTPEVCLEAVRRDPMVLERLKFKQRTPEVIIAALQGDARVFAWLIDADLTPAVCHAALQVRPALLRLFRPHLRTPEACVEALKWSHGAVLPDLRHHEYTHPLIAEWVETNWVDCVSRTSLEKAKQIALDILTTREAAFSEDDGAQGTERVARPAHAA